MALVLDGSSTTQSTCEATFEIFGDCVDVIKCVNQIKLPNYIHACFLTLVS